MIFALQFHPDASEQAMALSHLIADMEPHYRTDVEFAVVVRRDVSAEEARMVMAPLEEKFEKVHLIEGKRFGTGWPVGCNELWQETMMNCLRMKKDGKTNAEAVFAFDYDCLPLIFGWAEDIKSEWERCKAAGKLCVGYEDDQHINGNAIFDIHALELYPKLNGSGFTGWDWFHRKFLKQVGMGTKKIAQLYQYWHPEAPDLKPYVENGAVLLHGIKGVSGINAVRSLLSL